MAVDYLYEDLQAARDVREAESGVQEASPPWKR